MSNKKGITINTDGTKLEFPITAKVDGIEYVSKPAHLVITKELERQNKIMREALGFYANHEGQVFGDSDAPIVRDDDGYPVDDYDRLEGSYKKYGKRARQALKKVNKIGGAGE